MISSNLGQWRKLGRGCCKEWVSGNHRPAIFMWQIGSLDKCKEVCLQQKEKCRYIMYGWRGSQIDPIYHGHADICVVLSGEKKGGYTNCIKREDNCGIHLLDDTAVHSYEYFAGNQYSFLQYYL